MKIPENAFKPFPDASQEDLRRIVREVLDGIDVDTGQAESWSGIASEIETRFPELADILRDAAARLRGERSMNPTEIVHSWIRVSSKAMNAARRDSLREFVENSLYLDGTSGLSEDLLAWTLDQVDWQQLKAKLSDVETR